MDDFNVEDFMDENLSVDDKGLKKLLEKALEDVNEDMKEVDEFVLRIKDKMIDRANSAALEAYANFFVQALQAKGATRERHLRLINMIKDRVRVKEVNATNKNTKEGFWTITPNTIQELLNKAEEQNSDE